MTPMSEQPPSETELESCWRCFHCGEVFTDRAAALEHFGPSELAEPACKIDIAEYRRMEECCRSHHAEDTELHRALHAMDAEMRSKVREAEEQGYARGLEDAKKHPETLGLQRAAIASNGELSPAVHVVDGLEILAEPEPHEPIEVLPDGSVRAWPLCSDCPPVGYPTDDTRCAECPRAADTPCPPHRWLRLGVIGDFTPNPDDPCDHCGRTYAELTTKPAPANARYSNVSELLHNYKPHRKYPWFCSECGYPESESLKHPQKNLGNINGPGCDPDVT